MLCYVYLPKIVVKYVCFFYFEGVWGFFFSQFYLFDFGQTSTAMFRGLWQPLCNWATSACDLKWAAKMTAGILGIPHCPPLPQCPPSHCDNNQQIGKVNSGGRVGKWVWAGRCINISFSHEAEVSYIRSLSVAVTPFDPPSLARKDAATDCWLVPVMSAFILLSSL